MRTTIDGAGRIVIPKAIRDRLGLPGGAEVEISEEDGRITLERPPVDIRLERRDDKLVAVADDAADLPPLTAEDVRDVLEAVRAKRL